MNKVKLAGKEYTIQGGHVSGENKEMSAVLTRTGGLLLASQGYIVNPDRMIALLLAEVVPGVSLVEIDKVEDVDPRNIY